MGQAKAAIREQLEARQALVRLIHRIPFEEGQAILIETPTLHAIAGLSLQLHPKAPGNFFPKDELWIYQPVELPDGSAGWILVEPQRTFDRTESGGDFFTPFAWEGEADNGRLGFRKPITRSYLDAFVELMDARAFPAEHYIRRASPMTVSGAALEGGAGWWRLVEETGWPYFTVRELRFSGAGRTSIPLPHHSFSEAHVSRGRVSFTLESGGPPAAGTITPTQPIFLPASLPHQTISFQAAAPARLQFFTRPPA